MVNPRSCIAPFHPKKLPMDNRDRLDKQTYLYPRFPYRGVFEVNSLLFNANLQEFTQKVGYITGLHTAGKLTSIEAYEQIHYLWQSLKRSKKNCFDDRESLP
jgi:hypothetical protein